MSDTDRARVRALLKEFRNGMLVTTSSSGELRARPMAVAKLEDDDDVLFATSIESGKVHDAVEAGLAAVTFQSAKAYVVLSGTISVLQDRAKIEEAWSEPMRVWFPKGKDDPSICVLQLAPTHAEFWDMEGTKGLRYVFESAKAYATGTKPSTTRDQHGSVDRPDARKV